MNIVFVGHVDAGKSTIGGHILFLTGMVDKRTLEKYEKESKELNRESWYLSWALDTSTEERAKGITVECGRANLELDKRRFTILDAPGHKNFVPSMISGASQADVAVLVISARKGEFETGFEKGGQTREHATLVKTLGVRKLIVAINKMDDPTVGWSKERYDEIIEKVTPFLKQNGYNLKTEVEFMPISGFSGANLKDRVSKSVCSWYNGPSLLEYIDNMPSLERKIDALLLMPVTGKYKDLGTIVTGKIESGQVHKGQTIMIMPNKQCAEVLSINIEEAEVKSAMAGDNIRLKLKGVEEDDVATGFVICEPARPVKASTRFQVQLIIFNIRNIMAPGYTAVLHVHAASEEITIAKFDALIDKKTGEKMPKKPMFVRQGEVVIAEMECQGTVCMEPYADCAALGRFTLRDEGKTIAVGKVLKVLE